MVFIGTNFGHSSAACLVDRNGEVKFAIEEDRLNGEKNTSKFPVESLNLILSNSLNTSEIVWAEGWQLYKRLYLKGIWHSLKYYNDSDYITTRAIKEVRRFLVGLKMFNRYGHFYFVGHHLAHAYSLLPYGLPHNSIVYVSDTIGESECITFFYWDGQFRVLKRIFHPHSIGSVYHQMAYHLGFKGRTGPGKLMALSGYGKPLWLTQFSEISIVINGDFKIKQVQYPSYSIKRAPAKFIERINDPNFKAAMLNCLGKYEIGGENIAATVQEWFKLNSWQLLSQVVYIARNKLGLNINHIGLAGGAFLNCQANGYYIDNMSKLDIDSITISPWSEDSGTAIGAGIANFLRWNPSSEVPCIQPFLGPTASDKVLSSTRLKNHVLNAAKAVLTGKLIALVAGRLEFGPRALGGRCILGSPFLIETRSKLNECKSRLMFMPFAPAVLDEDFDSLFFGCGSKNMAWTVKAKPAMIKNIPSAIHITNEARVQVVKQENGLLYNFLKCIKEIKGIGIVLLTSLNRSNEPIPVYLKEAKEVCKSLKLDGILSELGWEEYSYTCSNNC